jgi:Uma2 family endonuclease
MVSLAHVPRHRFTTGDVMRMIEAGILHEDDHLELIDGELIEVSPQGPLHIALKDDIHRMLEQAYAPAAHVRDQGPLDVGQHSLAEPDLAVIRGAPRDYFDVYAAGRDALLVVEIAVTTRDYDRAKAAIYARGGVAAYWVIDVSNRQIERYERPVETGYRVVTTLAVELPGGAGTWPIASLLP